jgi:hypothetical protein
MIGACSLTLLRQGQQFEQGGLAAFCAQQRGLVRAKVGGLDSKAKAHEAPIGHDDVARALGRVTDRQNLKASAVQRMGGVGHLDLFGIGRRWVVEGGIMLLSRLTRWIMLTCGRFFGSGYETGYCYA